MKHKDRLTPDEKERLWAAIMDGYCCEMAADEWAAKIAVDKDLGEYRIGNAVLYMPADSVELNRARCKRISAISST